MRIIDLPPNEPGCEAYSGRPGSARAKPRASRNLACGVHTARRAGFGAAGGRMLVSGSGPVLRLAQAGMKLDELDLVVPHQANGRIVEAIRSRLRLAEDRVWNEKRRQGNTSSSSIPLALDTVLRQGSADRQIGLCAFGSGYTYGAALLRQC